MITYEFSYVSNLMPGEHTITLIYTNAQAGISSMRQLGIKRYSIDTKEVRR